MLRSRFFWRNFLSYVLIIGLTSFVVSYLLSVKTREFIEEDTRESLRDKLVFFTPIFQDLENLKSPLTQEHFYKLAHQSNTRVTIIKSDGQVLIETKREEVSGIANHINRPEIQQALKLGTGTAMRLSDTIGLPMIYYAKKIGSGSDSYFVRLGVPLSQLEARQASIRSAISVGAGFGIVVALLIALILARRITVPIAAITQITEEISHGNYGARLKDLPRNELGALGAAINQLAQAVEANISQREKMETIRREFTSNVSHELKTPLTSINGYVETLLAGALYDEKNNVRFLKIIHDNIHRMICLVTDLLRLSTIEASEGLIPLEPVKWQPIIQEVITRQAIRIKQKNMRLTTQIPENIPEVLGSPRAMTHILDNLLQNAINYTPAGGQIWIKAKQDKAHVELSVHDSGIGISKQDQMRIFERFYRVDAARSRDEGGTGLGLAIVKHLVIQIQGSTHIRSELQKGSVFTVRLPVA